ncbi:hypothetical protein [Photobacterium sanguinicancri]|uniref:Uncharacterized protein n=1 Tax=Photobacterium sanguinicancri TaxID=875932 RepID=A0AAW7Y6L7_9GAMM|nr:hypothetical protein [Photobacterium sanguinicancri]MDO6544283.1 hypothetical protein [Photobacterium sanguinicancri]
MQLSCNTSESTGKTVCYKQNADELAAETLSLSLSSYAPNTDLSQEQTQECDLGNVDVFNNAVTALFDINAAYDDEVWIHHVNSMV